MTYSYLVADIGGSKAHLALANHRASIIKEIIFPGANLDQALPEDVAYLTQQLISLSRSHQLSKQIKHLILVMGLSGYRSSDSHPEHIKAIFEAAADLLPSFRLIACNDSVIGLFSHGRIRQGINCIIGTGANCYGLASDGNEYTAGSWGHWLGDQGSGFALARQVISQVVKEWDGRSQSTLLTNSVLQHFAVNDVPSLIQLINQQTNPIPIITQSARIFSDEKLVQHSWINHQIIQPWINEIITSIQAVVNHLVFSAHSVPTLLFSGGVTHIKPLMQPLLNEALLRFPQLDPKIATKAPVIGAAQLARQVRQAGMLPLSLTLLDKNISA